MATIRNISQHLLLMTYLKLEQYPDRTCWCVLLVLVLSAVLTAADCTTGSGTRGIAFKPRSKVYCRQDWYRFSLSLSPMNVGVVSTCLCLIPARYLGWPTFTSSAAGSVQSLLVVSAGVDGRETLRKVQSVRTLAVAGLQVLPAVCQAGRKRDVVIFISCKCYMDCSSPDSLSMRRSERYRQRPLVRFASSIMRALQTVPSIYSQLGQHVYTLSSYRFALRPRGESGFGFRYFFFF